MITHSLTFLIDVRSRTWFLNNLIFLTADKILIRIGRFWSWKLDRDFQVWKGSENGEFDVWLRSKVGSKIQLNKAMKFDYSTEDVKSFFWMELNIVARKSGLDDRKCDIGMFGVRRWPKNCWSWYNFWTVRWNFLKFRSLSRLKKRKPKWCRM